jgi:hypothetical protein
MNELVKSIIKKAGFPDFEQMYVVSDQDELKKLIDLVVVECAEFAVKQQAERDVRNIVSDNPARDFALGVIKHFGGE